MKLRLSLLAISLAVFAACPAFAQAPAGAPAGSTGQCKDGSYWTGASKSGACRGHKGIQTWFADAGAKPAPAAKPAPGSASPASANVASKPAPGATPTTKPAPTTPIKPATTAASSTPAPGGGNGQVWVNAETKVYHCQGDRYYGTTKNGKYMSEADAQKMGAKPSRNKPCSAK